MDRRLAEDMPLPGVGDRGRVTPRLCRVEIRVARQAGSTEEPAVSICEQRRQRPEFSYVPDVVFDS